ncbi:MAG: DUF4177 domain-containing protein [Paracoccaceae bacterium]|nr:MAG: DUF4177 domain-containing protein [Paracoccaceae bacterium]
MQNYEYRVVPAPRRGEKTKGAKTVSERFGVALAHVMNDLARDGWEYLRADALPCEERVGLTGTATHFHHMLVFRRPVVQPAATARPAAPPAAPTMTDMSDLVPDEAEERTVLVPLARPEPGAAPPVGPVVPFPNGRG